MTQTFFLGQLRLALVAIIAYAGGRGWLTPTDAGLATAMLTSLGPLIGPWAWSVYANINSKLVPAHTVVIDPVHTEANADKQTATVRTSDGTITGKVVSVLFAAFLLSAFLAGNPAMAKTKRTPTPDVAMSSEQAQIKLKSPKQIGQDIEDAFDRPLTTASNAIVSVLSKPLQDLANFLTTGLDEAAALAVAVPDLQDGNGQACWRTMAATGRILKEHPVPLTLKIAADLESFRLLTMAANRICQNAACTQVFTEAGNLVNAAAPMPLALPNLTVLCSKVPAIAIVAPQTVAAAAPVPVPASVPAAPVPAPAGDTAPVDPK